MEPLAVFFDTSALPRHLERPGGPFEVLAEYAEIEIVKVFVPEVCSKEWSSQLVDETRKHLQECDRAIDAASRGPVALPSDVRTAFEKAASAIAEANPSLEKIIEDKTGGLLRQLRADILPISAGHGAAVMAGYFGGRPPFRGLKERQDIPDAFVLEALKELRGETEGPILVVAQDKRLAEAMRAIPDIEVYPTIRELLGAEQIARALKETKFEAQWEAWLERFDEQLPKTTGLILGDLKTQIENEMAYAELKSSLIPSDNNTAVITGTAAPEDLQLDWENAEKLGAGWVSVPFRGSCTVLADFDVFRSDAYSQPDWVSVQMGDPEKDHYFEAQADFVIEVSGTASIQFDENDILTGELTEPTHVEIDELEFEVMDHD